MNIYLLWQGDNNGYDTYDSCVVIAKNEDEARKIHPNGDESWDHPYGTWASRPEYVKVELIGVTVPGQISGVVVSSFNAG